MAHGFSLGEEVERGLAVLHIEYLRVCKTLTISRRSD